MGVVLKEAIINEGFTHYKPVIKTILILCADQGPEYFINAIQKKNSNDNSASKEETVTLAANMKNINEAIKVFEDFDKALALEGFGLSHTKGQNSSKETQTGEDPGITPEDAEKQRKEDLVRDIVETLDESLEE